MCGCWMYWFDLIWFCKKNWFKLFDDAAHVKSMLLLLLFIKLRWWFWWKKVGVSELVAVVDVEHTESILLSSLSTLFERALLQIFGTWCCCCLSFKLNIFWLLFVKTISLYRKYAISNSNWKKYSHGWSNSLDIR